MIREMCVTCTYKIIRVKGQGGECVDSSNSSLTQQGGK